MAEINKDKLQNAFQNILNTKNDICANNELEDILIKPENAVIRDAYYDLKIKLEKITAAIIDSIS